MRICTRVLNIKMLFFLASLVILSLSSFSLVYGESKLSNNVTISSPQMEKEAQITHKTLELFHHVLNNDLEVVEIPIKLNLAAGISLDPVAENLFFGFQDVKTIAEELALNPYQNPDGQVPEFLINVSYDQWRSIRFNPKQSYWKEQKLPFELQFFHPGLFYNRFVTLNIIDDTGVSKLPFNTDFFIYGDESLKNQVINTPLEYAGFRIHFQINNNKYKDEVAVFLGASYFRAVAKDTQYGLSARGLAIDTALPSGEEFPYYREFWIEKPKPYADRIVVYALMDSPSLTGAFKYVIIPGENTIMQVDSSLYLRKEVQKIGIAPLTSMYLYGEPENGWAGDFRPEVHDTDGLLIQNAQDEFIWSPLANPERLAIHSWKQNSLKGFGFFQRDNDFDHYQDLEARYDLRPTLWIEPKGDWGKGFVELIEIPSELEIHDNMVAFFVPTKPVANDNTALVALPYPNNMNFSYNLYWLAPGKNVHNLAEVVATRIAKGNDDNSIRFLIDFEGEKLKNLPVDTGLSSEIILPYGLYLVDKQLIKNPVTQGWRLVFQVAFPKNNASFVDRLTAKTKQSYRIEAYLNKGENIPSPLTETWVYNFLW